MDYLRGGIQGAALHAGRRREHAVWQQSEKQVVRMERPRVGGGADGTPSAVIPRLWAGQGRPERAQHVHGVGRGATPHSVAIKAARAWSIGFAKGAWLRDGVTMRSVMMSMPLLGRRANHDQVGLRQECELDPGEKPIDASRTVRADPYDIDGDFLDYIHAHSCSSPSAWRWSSLWWGGDDASSRCASTRTACAMRTSGATADGLFLRVTVLLSNTPTESGHPDNGLRPSESFSTQRSSLVLSNYRLVREGHRTPAPRASAS